MIDLFSVNIILFVYHTNLQKKNRRKSLRGKSYTSLRYIIFFKFGVRRRSNTFHLRVT